MFLKFTELTEEANGVRQDLAEFQPPFRAEMAEHPLNVHKLCPCSVSEVYTVQISCSRHQTTNIPNSES